MFVAIAGGLPYFGYAAHEESDSAAVLALLNDDTSIPGRTKDTPVVIYEVSDDWELNGFGNITASKLLKTHKFEVPAKAHLKLIEAFSVIQDCVIDHELTNA